MGMRKTRCYCPPMSIDGLNNSLLGVMGCSVILHFDEIYICIYIKINTTIIII
jgi:hypothetical protein